MRLARGLKLLAIQRVLLIEGWIALKKLPVGLQSFRKIIEGDYVYVDKTQYIYELVNNASYYFLSRPRRFGKSLLLDTISEVFCGDKGLFKGLWIYNSNYNFHKHPVIRLDMSNNANKTPDILEKSLALSIKRVARAENIAIGDEIPSEMFMQLIEAFYEKNNRRVVVLIDEYDKPILDNIDNINISKANQRVLRDFYGILKSMDQYLQFIFITGVSKFTKTSLFSGLNNLTDITLSKKYPNICGITIDDLQKYFISHIEYLAVQKSFMQNENLHNAHDIYDEILAWYDGYSWDGQTRVINPFSLLSFLAEERFSGFWYASGTPRFLLDLIRKNPESYTNLRNFEIAETMLDSIEIDKLTIEPLLFQTGYLTIKDIPVTAGIPVYHLDIPNYEVREAFNVHVLSALTENGDVRTGQMRLAVGRALLAGDLPKTLEILRGFFASIPYNLHIDLEAYYHSLFYAFMSALGFDVSLEVSVAKGRVDAVLEIDEKVYIIEFKYCKCPSDASDEIKRDLFETTLNEAVRQITIKGYADKYLGSGKTVFRAVFAFLGRGDIEMRTL